MLERWSHWPRRFFVGGLALVVAGLVLWIASFWQPSLRSGETAIGLGSGAVHFARGDYDARFPWHLNVCSKTHWFSPQTLVIWNWRPLWQRQSRWHWQHGSGFFRVQAPLYLALGLGLGISGLAYLGERWHRWRCARRVVCARCGCDLRASPQRCPECGAPAAALHHAATR